MLLLRFTASVSHQHRYRGVLTPGKLRVYWSIYPDNRSHIVISIAETGCVLFEQDLIDKNAERLYRHADDLFCEYAFTEALLFVAKQIRDGELVTKSSRTTTKVELHSTRNLDAPVTVAILDKYPR